ncbi:MAG: hypothetical protein JNN32_02170 [Flavobacteriales bacterium]|nr:hypothetical protein [Flavobacteriales bacterium]
MEQFSPPLMNLEQVRNDLSFVRSWSGRENYHFTWPFPHQTISCDVYFRAPKKNVDQAQLDRLNAFVQDYARYIPQFDEFIAQSTRAYERWAFLKGSVGIVEFQVIDFPLDTTKYDFVLVAAKTYERLLWKRSIGFRAEFRNGEIISMKRCRSCTDDN